MCGVGLIKIVCQGCCSLEVLRREGLAYVFILLLLDGLVDINNLELQRLELRKEQT